MYSVLAYTYSKPKYRDYSSISILQLQLHKLSLACTHLHSSKHWEWSQGKAKMGIFMAAGKLLTVKNVAEIQIILHSSEALASCSTCII